MGVIKEFKKFAVKGNMIDLTIGVVVGSAFGKLMQSFVNDLLMPFLSYLTGNIDISTLTFAIKIPKWTKEGKLAMAEIVFRYGSFGQAVVDFVLIAFALFIFIQLINRLNVKASDPNQKEVPMPKDIELLTEIRDLLKRP